MDKFVDDIGTVRVVNGLIRIQTVRKIQTEGGEQRIQERGDLILPMASFLSLHSVVNRSVEQMLEQGILTRKAGQDTPVEGGAPEQQADAKATESKRPATEAKK